MLPSNFKKKGLLALIAGIASVTMLAACSDIEVKPVDDKYNAALIVGDNEVVNNELKEIYDALIHAGDSNSSKILNNILYSYAKAIYGDFWKIQEAVETNNTSAIQELANKHSAYEGKTERVVIFYNEVLYRIRSTFLGYVNDSSYQTRSHFVEKKFYDAQIKNYHDLKTEAEAGYKTYNEAEKLVVGGFRLSEDYVETGKVVLDGKKQSAGDAANAYFKDIFGTYKNYIELNLLADVYRSELTAQYLYTQNYGQIKLTSARKVETMKLSDNDRYPNAVRDLVKAYCKNVIGTADAPVAGNLQAKYDFRFLDDINQGTMDDFTAEEQAMATTILNEAHWTLNTNGYYNESAKGAVMAQYEKITEDRFSDDSAIRSDFTNNGAYTVQTGLEIKLNNLKAKDSSTFGWYTAGGLDSALPSSLSKRLFKVQVANEVDHKNDESVKFKYGSYIGDSYYLTPETYEDETVYPYAVYESGSWYICKVEEAVKSSKISGGADSYNTDADPFAEERVARKIGYMLSSNDSWKNQAQKYFVNEMAILYNDSHVYHYFKETFPDLFND
ncbi:MAG: hypothetical protein MJ241_05115 [Bacilli bacterium]|nr:hypothetical protein [Bacilli bacterium]